jgi:hypothetical protein
VIAAIGALLVAAPVAVRDRTPLAMVLATPTGEAAKTNSSELIRVATEVFGRHTDFELELVDERAVESCRGRLYCIADEARSDYSVEQLVREDGGRMPYKEHLQRLKEEGRPYPRFMLVLTNVAIEGEADRVTAVFVDTDVALGLLHDVARTSRWEDRIEAAVNEQAVLAAPPRRELSDPNAAAELLERLVAEDLRPVLEKIGRWEPWGSIALAIDAEEPLEITVDDRTVATSVEGVNELAQVSAGEHRIRIQHPNYAPVELTVQVERGARVELHPDLVRTANEENVLRPITEWSGLLLVVTGAVITAFALVRHDSKVSTVCYGSADGCSHDGFVTFGYSADAVDGKNVNPPGVLMIPLGYSLAITGATWSLGTLLFGDDGDIPWIQWIAGLALGAAAYGISVAVGG